MKKMNLLTCAVLGTLLSTPAWAASPIPSFDKEAVTTHPYNRTGEQAVISEKPENLAGEYKPGNTGTEEHPAFYIKAIKLTGISLQDKDNKLADILNEYSDRNVAVE